ncbi:hypothetical protein [Paenibacillus glycinis]|uniref:Uncharacterized protein n=1 Tax=Paenibacillus glycinis TaxID=2697035 RepID=A0ABW9XUQ4_9BACL|nr:hypothetical protein [Paenibacillus glycinis]NBD26054.1 hypothetical protein [Paenibacillus glycinis]
MLERPVNGGGEGDVAADGGVPGRRLPVLCWTAGRRAKAAARLRGDAAGAGISMPCRQSRGGKEPA